MTRWSLVSPFCEEPWNGQTGVRDIQLWYAWSTHGRLKIDGRGWSGTISMKKTNFQMTHQDFLSIAFVCIGFILMEFTTEFNHAMTTHARALLHVLISDNIDITSMVCWANPFQELRHVVYNPGLKYILIEAAAKRSCSFGDCTWSVSIRATHSFCMDARTHISRTTVAGHFSRSSDRRR
jgi:hypothetical protein